MPIYCVIRYVLITHYKGNEFDDNITSYHRWRYVSKCNFKDKKQAFRFFLACNVHKNEMAVLKVTRRD